MLLSLFLFDSDSGDLVLFIKHILTWKPVKGSSADSVDPDQSPHNVASDQSLQCLLT